MDDVDERISRGGLALAVLVIAVFAIALSRESSPDLAFVAVAILGSAWALATAVDAVRHHEYFHVANAVLLTAIGVLLLVGDDDAVPLVVVFIGLGIAGLVAEGYNRRKDTSHLRCGTRPPEETGSGRR